MFFKLSRKFSTSITNVPIVDIAPYLNNSSKSLCNDVATALHDYGLLIIKDPRVTEFDNEQFLDIMEDYFITTANKFYNNEPVEDFFPNVAYRVGATPEFVERAKEFEEIVSR